MESVASQIDSLKKERASVESATRERIQEHAERRARATRSLLIMVLCAFLIAFGASFRIGRLREEYASAYEWWRTGYRNGPTPEGLYPKVSVSSAAVALNYPPVAFLSSLAFRSSDVSRFGASFLLDMASGFGLSRNLQGIHWNGSAEQLRFDRMSDFLPTDAAAFDASGNVQWAYVWSSFTAKTSSGSYVNPWAGTLWPTIDHFSTSPAIQAYYTDRSGEDAQLVEGLYRGGLCYIALNMASANRTASNLLYALVGSKTVVGSQPCSTVQVANSMLDGGTMGFGLVLMLSHAAPFPYNLLAAAAGGAAGAFVGKKGTCGTTSLEVA